MEFWGKLNSVMLCPRRRKNVLIEESGSGVEKRRIKSVKMDEGISSSVRKGQVFSLNINTWILGSFMPIFNSCFEIFTSYNHSL